MNTEDIEEANAIFIAGELGGLVFNMNVRAMERFLERYRKGAHPDFRYAKLCEAAVVFARAVQGSR